MCAVALAFMKFDCETVDLFERLINLKSSSDWQSSSDLLGRFESQYDDKVDKISGGTQEIY
jgi:hypothetical protein